MPIKKRWTRFTIANVEKLPNRKGVYELANRSKKIIDIGGSDSRTIGVKGRLLSHLKANKYPTAWYFRCDFALWGDSGIDMEASHGSKFKEKHGRRPRYTKRLPKKKWYL